MRIALVTTSFAQSNNDLSMPPLIDYVRSISDRVTLDVYALQYPFEPRTFALFGARVIAFGYGRAPRVARALSRRRVAARIARQHAHEPYDVIHAIWADRPAQIAADLSERLSIPVITSFYGGEAVWLPQIQYGSLRSPGRRRTLARVLDRSAAVTVGSATLADTVRSTFDTPVQISPFGYAPARFNPDGPRELLGPDRHIVTAASFGPVKGLDILLQALHQVAARTPRLLEDTTFHLIGPDPRDRALRQALSQQIGALPVRLHEGRPHWEMPAIYRAADLALVTSRFESQCFAAVEPAACGTPVMGTSVGILPEFVAPDWLCRPGDPEALLEIITRVLSTPENWGAEAVRQRAWLSENATLDHARDRFLSLYADVIAGTSI
ncbi:glycosyltransferase family 4 protein [Pseudooceanicola sp.]|uniref:glycosyltransferase family 4 protein n=1 Tax=Pseudooceanicola sp. TaxID=1914328 RepID=UPI0035C6F165